MGTARQFFVCVSAKNTVDVSGVEKLGEIPDIKTGSDYENITSDDLAADRAKWENWKNSRLTDSSCVYLPRTPWLYPASVLWSAFSFGRVS